MQGSGVSRARGQVGAQARHRLLCDQRTFRKQKRERGSRSQITSWRSLLTAKLRVVRPSACSTPPPAQMFTLTHLAGLAALLSSSSSSSLPAFPSTAITREKMRRDKRAFSAQQFAAPKRRRRCASICHDGQKRQNIIAACARATTGAIAEYRSR